MIMGPKNPHTFLTVIKIRNQTKAIYNKYAFYNVSVPTQPHWKTVKQFMLALRHDITIYVIAMKSVGPVTFCVGKSKM